MAGKGDLSDTWRIEPKPAGQKLHTCAVMQTTFSPSLSVMSLMMPEGNTGRHNPKHHIENTSHHPNTRFMESL